MVARPGLQRVLGQQAARGAGEDGDRLLEEARGRGAEGLLALGDDEVAIGLSVVGVGGMELVVVSRMKTVR
jgi:hypothetical protein